MVKNSSIEEIIELKWRKMSEYIRGPCSLSIHQSKDLNVWIFGEVHTDKTSNDDFTFMKFLKSLERDFPDSKFHIFYKDCPDLNYAHSSEDGELGKIKTEYFKSVNFEEKEKIQAIPIDGRRFENSYSYTLLNAYTELYYKKIPKYSITDFIPENKFSAQKPILSEIDLIDSKYAKIKDYLYEQCKNIPETGNKTFEKLTDNLNELVAIVKENNNDAVNVSKAFCQKLNDILLSTLHIMDLHCLAKIFSNSDKLTNVLHSFVYKDFFKKFGFDERYFYTSNVLEFNIKLPSKEIIKECIK